MGDVQQELLIFGRSMLDKPHKMWVLDQYEVVNATSFTREFPVPKDQLWLVHQASFKAAKGAGGSYAETSVWVHQKSERTDSYLYLIHPPAADLGAEYYCFPSSRTYNEHQRVMDKSPAYIFPEGKLVFKTSMTGANVATVHLTAVVSKYFTTMLETLPVVPPVKRGFWKYL